MHLPVNTNSQLATTINISTWMVNSKCGFKVKDSSTRYNIMKADIWHFCSFVWHVYKYAGSFIDFAYYLEFRSRVTLLCTWMTVIMLHHKPCRCNILDVIATNSVIVYIENCFIAYESRDINYHNISYQLIVPRLSTHFGSHGFGWINKPCRLARHFIIRDIKSAYKYYFCDIWPYLSIFF